MSAPSFKKLRGKPPHEELPRGKTASMIGAFLVAGLAAVAIYTMPCATKGLFGIPCPGCGLTRATLAMFRLNPIAVWHFHPLAPVLAPLLGLFLWKGIADGFSAPWGRVPDAIFRRFPRGLWSGLLAAMLLLWGLRLATGTHPDPVAPEDGLISGIVFGQPAPPASE